MTSNLRWLKRRTSKREVLFLCSSTAKPLNSRKQKCHHETKNKVFKYDSALPSASLVFHLYPHTCYFGLQQVLQLGLLVQCLRGQLGGSWEAQQDDADVVQAALWREAASTGVSDGSWPQKCTSNINSTWVNRVISENRSLSPQRIRVRAGAGECKWGRGRSCDILRSFKLKRRYVTVTWWT